MNASIYSMNNGAEMVWQLGNSRVVRSHTQSLYQTRKNQKSEWENKVFGSGIKPLVRKVEAALKA